MPTDRLPRLDEHEIMIAAGADDVWLALSDALDAGFSRRAAARYARAVGCTDHTASGPRPLERGSTLPGFRVTAAERPRELVLAGHHHFSTYTLVFRLDAPEPGATRLRAESRAVFPGLHGRAYRLLVLRSGQHVRGVRSLLAGCRRRAEARSRT